MEIGSVAHKYYLINIRLPVNERKGINVGIGEIKDIRLVVSVCLAAPPQRDCAPRCCHRPGHPQPLPGSPPRSTAGVLLFSMGSFCLKMCPAPQLPSFTRGPSL